MSTNRELVERLWKVRDWVAAKSLPVEKVEPLFREIEERLCPQPPKKKK